MLIKSMMRLFHSPVTYAAGAITLIGVQQAAAAPSTGISYFVDNVNPYAVSSTDLLEGLSPDGTSVYVNNNPGEGTSSSPSVLTNGTFGITASGSNKHDPGVYSEAFTIGSTTTPTESHTTLYYTLPANAGGYTITGINTYTGWADINRVDQNYTVAYALASAPSTYVDLATVAKKASALNLKTSIDVTDLTNVVALKFSFPGQQSDYVGYREIDVIGAPVPEPASIGVLAIGAMGLLARRRRSR